jgi:sugar phosphate isomerase/epimerase
MLGIPALASAGILTGSNVFASSKTVSSVKNLKTSLNAFSFNDPLSKGQMKIDDMLSFCSDQGFDAVDITAYYFPGYPNVPEDSFLYHTKKKAFNLGLEISGTGVRNDFTWPEKEKRKESIQLVKNWIIAAEKLGAPVIRIFGGTQEPKGYTWDQIAAWMYDDIHECIEFGKNHGVIIGLQNHYDFVKTSEHVIKIMDTINSEWFGLILDTGSYRIGDPYEEIKKTIKYAVNWQVKEKIFIEGKEVDTDLDKLFAIIKNSDYKGYLPIETLGAGEPKEKISKLLVKVKAAMGKIG